MMLLLLLKIFDHPFQEELVYNDGGVVLVPLTSGCTSSCCCCFCCCCYCWLLYLTHCTCTPSFPVICIVVVAVFSLQPEWVSLVDNYYSTKSSKEAVFINDEVVPAEGRGLLEIRLIRGC